MNIHVYVYTHAQMYSAHCIHVQYVHMYIHLPSNQNFNGPYEVVEEVMGWLG